MPVLIIAEAGVNHNGEISKAISLVDAAADSGADVVKFQTFHSSDLVAKNTPKAEYQKETTGSKEDQLDMIKGLELSEEDHFTVAAHCIKRDIHFLSSPFDISSVALLKRIGVSSWKIASGEITNYPMLNEIGSCKQQVYLSTGMADLGEIESCIRVLTDAGTNRSQIVLLHCNTQYPTPLSDVNLAAMVSMMSAFKLPVGYSDHTLGIEVPIAAVAMGAVVIEKHLTLDKNLPGPDHRASLSPDEFSSLVTCIRNIEMAHGDGVKAVTDSELENKIIARKSIVASKQIEIGDLFSADNITTKRPGTGMSPMLWEACIGKKAGRDFMPDELIDFEA